MKANWIFSLLIALFCFTACEQDSFVGTPLVENSTINVVETQLEARSNKYPLLPSEMGDLHNLMLDKYYSAYNDQDLPNALYSNQDMGTLISRVYALNQSNLPNIFGEVSEDELTTTLLSLFPEQSSDLSEFEVYQSLVEHQKDELLAADVLSDDLIMFIYDHSIIQTDLTALAQEVEAFNAEQNLDELEEFILYSYLETYLASDVFWSDWDDDIQAANGWWVRGADAWGTIVMGGLGAGMGPIGAVVGGAIGGQAFSAAMEHT